MAQILASHGLTQRLSVSVCSEVNPQLLFAGCVFLMLIDWFNQIFLVSLRQCSFTEPHKTPSLFPQCWIIPNGEHHLFKCGSNSSYSWLAKQQLIPSHISSVSGCTRILPGGATHAKPHNQNFSFTLRSGWEFLIASACADIHMHWLLLWFYGGSLQHRR